MIYFSYNDFMDCTENGEIKKVEENILKYEVKNRKEIENKNKSKIIQILRERIELKEFLKEFFNLVEIGESKNISYCNSMKSTLDREINNNIICKIKNKEIFIFIKVIENIDNNITYKMFEHSLKIIKKWKEEQTENIRYPIVIPIVIYIGKEVWKNNSKIHNNVNYISFENNKINFSYNILNIENLKISELKNMKSEVAKEFIEIKNKYLQIN